MSSRRSRSAARLAVFAALLAMCLRLLLPLLHGGHDCHHAPAAYGAVEVCSCGAVHQAAGDPVPTGEHHEHDGAPHAACLACQVEDHSPGGAALTVLVVIGRPVAPQPSPSTARGIDVDDTCVRPPSRAPPRRNA
ncbi:MAG: hypothetical protein KAI24_24340 [Planctomycetes bacterium]|nr:hypothetical protein [Planctomycetota bacterium]